MNMAGTAFTKAYGDGELVKLAKRTLYVHRTVVNADEIIAWAKSQGFTTTLPADDMHVTIAFSRAPVDWSKVSPKDDTLRVVGGPRTIARLGDGEATVLKFASTALAQRWQQFCNAGASWDWPEYQSHITISFEAPDGVEKTAQSYTGPIVLGPEVFGEVKEDWKDDVVEKYGATMTSPAERIQALKERAAALRRLIGVLRGDLLPVTIDRSALVDSALTKAAVPFNRDSSSTVSVAPNDLVAAINAVLASHSTPPSRRVVTSCTIEKISAVKKPAIEGALATILV